MHASRAPTSRTTRKYVCSADVTAFWSILISSGSVSSSVSTSLTTHSRQQFNLISQIFSWFLGALIYYAIDRVLTRLWLTCDMYGFQVAWCCPYSLLPLAKISVCSWLLVNQRLKSTMCCVCKDRGSSVPTHTTWFLVIVSIRAQTVIPSLSRLRLSKEGFTQKRLYCTPMDLGHVLSCEPEAQQSRRCIATSIQNFSNGFTLASICVQQLTRVCFVRGIRACVEYFRKFCAFDPRFIGISCHGKFLF